LIALDSSFVIAFHNSRDAHHAAAKRVMKRFIEGEWGVGLLPEYVILEVLTVLAARRGHEIAVRVGELLLRARELEFVPCSEHFLATLEIFRAEAGIGLSFADAAIIAICRRRGAGHVATFDSDFRKVRGIAVVPDSTM